MKQEFKGFLKIFSFTFRQHVKSRGFLMSGIVIGLLCLILPVAIMTFTGRPEDNEGDNEPDIVQGEFPEEEESEVSVNNVKIHSIYVVDEIETYEKESEVSAWYSTLNEVGDSRFSDLTYEAFPDVNSAAKAAEGSDDILLLVVEMGAYGQELSVLLPEDSGLTEDDACEYEIFLMEYYTAVQVEKAGLNADVLAELSRPVDLQVIADAETEEPGIWDDSEGFADEESMEDVSMMMLKDVLSMILPYVTIMVLYFMVLAYGQGVANSVIMEKTSKLMDTFLVTVKPGAMIMGKVLAIAASGLLQLFAWAICLAGSFAAGTMIVKTINPETDMLLIRLFETFGKLSGGLFSFTGILFTILILISGFLLYCALAAVGGAIASKPEDLSTTNILFTMALVISFLLALSGGALQGELASTSWMLYMPFTALLVAPGMALLGEISIVQCLISLAIILLSALIVIRAAGHIYKMLIFYKGDTLSVQKVLKMLAGKEKS
ncbi:MAG: ABC transporter permease [Lachnospiraceae bacterium]|nr:ABC transporter permease [Lachnospiraceae bacterium]